MAKVKIIKTIPAKPQRIIPARPQQIIPGVPKRTETVMMWQCDCCKQCNQVTYTEVCVMCCRKICRLCSIEDPEGYTGDYMHHYCKHCISLYEKYKTELSRLEKESEAVAEAWEAESLALTVSKSDESKQP